MAGKVASVSVRAGWQARQHNASSASIDGIQIPTGPRLGNEVVECAGLTKAFGDRLLIDGASFTIPPGAVVGAALHPPAPPGAFVAFGAS